MARRVCEIASPLVDLARARKIRAVLEKASLPSQSLPQLYRFCFLMLGDAVKALEVFEAVMHDASLRAAAGEMPKERTWLFRDARDRCLEISETGLQPEEIELQTHDLGAHATVQIAKLEPQQLAIWISGAPDPQRTALALFYLDEFSHEEILAVAELKTNELAKLLGNARQEFQAWLNASFPHDEHIEELPA